MKYLQKTDKIKKIKLDIKDQKILSILAENSRISLTQISKRVQLSRDAIKYRIKNYEKKGLIQGYVTSVNMSLMGYNNYHLFIKLNNPSQEKEKNILNKLTKLPFVRAIIKFSGNFDFEIALVSKNLDELDININKIINTFSGTIQDYEILAVINTYVAQTFPKGFFDDFQTRIVPKRKEKGKIHLTKKDYEILKIISNDATISSVDLANKLKISADTSAYRIKNMVKNKIINGFIPIINYASLGYDLHTILLNINPLNDKNIKLLEIFLLSNKNVLWAVKTIGRFNLLAYVLTKNIGEFQKAIINLRSLFPKQITNYLTLTAYEEYKYIYFPKDLF